MSEEVTLEETQRKWHGTLQTYLIGFFSSLILTFISFALVATRVLTNEALITTIVLLALVQAIVQIRYFLHLRKEDEPRWKSYIFIIMLTVLSIIALGTLWIMFDLYERVMNV